MSDRLKLTASEEATFTEVFRRSPRRVSDGAAVTAPADAKSTQAENELIVQRLLGWERRDGGEIYPWIRGTEWLTTPTFTTWHDCGLIMEALSKLECKTAVGDKSISGSWWCTVDHVCELRTTGPLAVRAAALSYLRSLER